MSVRLVVSNPAGAHLATAVPERDRDEPAMDPRDPSLYRAGLSSARAALRDGRARRRSDPDRARPRGGPDDEDARPDA